MSERAVSSRDGLPEQLTVLAVCLDGGKKGSGHLPRRECSPPSFQSYPHSNHHLTHFTCLAGRHLSPSLPLQLSGNGFYLCQQSSKHTAFISLYLSLLLRPGPQFLHYPLAECVIGMIWHRLGRASRRADVTIWRVMNWRLKALFSQCVSYPCVYFWFTFDSPCLGYGRTGAATYLWMGLWDNHLRKTRMF
jgi:hypothetical protein